MSGVASQIPAVEPARSHEDRRTARRVPASWLPSVSANLVAGPVVHLVDLSLGGALVWCEQKIPGRSATGVTLRTPDRTMRVTARVLRSEVAQLSSKNVVYHYALEFTEESRREVHPFLQDLLDSAAASNVMDTGAAALPEASAPEEPEEANAAEAPEDQGAIQVLDVEPLHSAAEGGSVAPKNGGIVAPKAATPVANPRLRKAMVTNRW